MVRVIGFHRKIDFIGNIKEGLNLKRLKNSMLDLNVIAI